MTTITETPIPMDVIDMYAAAYGEETAVGYLSHAVNTIETFLDETGGEFVSHVHGPVDRFHAIFSVRGEERVVTVVHGVDSFRITELVGTFMEGMHTQRLGPRTWTYPTYGVVCSEDAEMTPWLDTASDDDLASMFRSIDRVTELSPWFDDWLDSQVRWDEPETVTMARDTILHVDGFYDTESFVTSHGNLSSGTVIDDGFGGPHLIDPHPMYGPPEWDVVSVLRATGRDLGEVTRFTANTAMAKAIYDYQEARDAFLYGQG